MSRRFVVGILVIGLCLSSGIPTALTASYDLTVSGSVDTPSRTVTFDGDTYQVSGVATAKPGETLSVDVTAPSETDYRVNLYNSDRQIQAQRPGTGTSDVQFDLTGYEPGSYMLLLSKDGDYKTIFPVVVSGYEITVEAPSTATVGESVTVAVTLTQITDVEDPNAVTVVVTNATHTQRVTATHQDAATYRATISLHDVSPGEYRVYAVVEGTDSAFTKNRNELLGVSDATTLTVTGRDTPSTTKTDGQTPTTATTTPSPTDTETTPPPTSTSLTTTTQPPTTTPTPTATTTTTGDSPSDRSQTTTANVITPASSPSNTSTTTPGLDVPGFAMQGSLLALLSALYLCSRRMG